MSLKGSGQGVSFRVVRHESGMGAGGEKRPSAVILMRGPASDGCVNYLASNSIRDFFTRSQFSFTQSTSPCMGSSRLRPRAVSSYSTRGGTSGNNSLVSNPSLSKLRTVTVSILCEMPGIALSSSENRARPPGSCAKERIKKMLHLSPTLVRSSRTAAGSL
jgi:hypothetical protein